MKTKIYEELSDLFPLWREATLEKKSHEKKEVNFIVEVFNKYSRPIRSVIDLGGGVGLHSDLLQQHGYDVSLFDQSEKAISIAKHKNPSLQVIRGSFEYIGVENNFDAAICMWSTLSYVHSEAGRRNFYGWQASHINHLIILDQPNFDKYPTEFNKTYRAENESHILVVHRSWNMENNFKRTKFIYEIEDKRTGEIEKIEDAEDQQYLTINQLEEYLGNDWVLKDAYGDYDINITYNENSSRLITVFKRRSDK